MRANSAISVQLVPPHNVASRAMKSSSRRSCSAFSARGSGSSEKISANRFISGLLSRSHRLNLIPYRSQQLIRANMRFPCPPGEDADEGSAAMDRDFLIDLF